MRLTILKADGFVAIDGEGYDHIDLSYLDPDFHALQWYEDHGEIEWKHMDTSMLRIVENEVITNLNAYQRVIADWGVRKQEVAAEAAAIAAEVAATRTE